MTLLIDNSNSRTKWLSWKPESTLSESQIQVFDTETIRLGNIPKQLLSWQGNAIIASVVPEALAQLKQQLTGVKQWHELSYQSPLGVGIDYPKPEQIGADRLANAAAIAARYPQGAIALDFGTALTFDIVAPVKDKGLCYRGGVIAAGLDSLTNYLHERTALLPQVQLGDSPPPALGTSTESAIRSGAWYGYRGLIQGILSNLRRELQQPDLPAIGTGGYARRIAGDLPEVVEIDHLLTLRGLAEIAQRVF